MKLKKGVKSIGLRPELILVIIIAERIYLDKGKELVITSINDSKHSETSAHHSGSGVDFRTRYFNKKEKLEVFNALRVRLTKDYGVKLESDHIHLQYRPRQ